MASSVDSKTANRVKGSFGSPNDGDLLAYNDTTKQYEPVDPASVDPSFEYEVAFVEVEEVLQVFRKSTSITAIKVANAATLTYQINETGPFTALTIVGNDVTTPLPIALDVNDTITWKITYAATKDKAPTIHSSSIIASSIMTLFIPMRQFSPIIPPWMIAP